ncbi:hypothetical protein C8Q80DRAFT_1358212 [Daedaleopsis nitida]|nr:hypothetical protein C8Q80DRAFT_1358212 [Daedaleopsis nitida]
MLVCRLWRALALSYPRLWQEIYSVKGLRWLQIALARAGNGLLDLHMQDALPSVAVSALPILIAHSRRLRTLSFPPLKGGQYRKALRLLMRDLPALTRLELSIASETGTVIDHYPLVVSPEAFPALRILRLSCFLIPWEPSAYAKLTRIDLRGCTRSISSSPPRFEPYPPVHFPKLRRLVIWDRVTDVSRFMSYIRLPPTTVVRLVATYNRQTDIRALSNVFLSLLPPDRTGLPMLRSSTKAVLMFSEENGKMYGFNSTKSITLKLCAPVRRSWDAYLGRALAEFPVVFAGAPLEELGVTGNLGYVAGASAWLAALSPFPKLKLLHVGGDGSARDLGDYRGGQRHQPPKALLETLRRRAAVGAPMLERLELVLDADEADGPACDQSVDEHRAELEALVGEFLDVPTWFRPNLSHIPR